MAAIRFKRGTRAQLDAAAAAGQLALGEPYVITDEDAMAFGLGASSYMDVEGAMRTWASGMTVRKHQKVVSPADNEEYRRITATGGGTTDPADDLTNYRAASFERTDAILGAEMLAAAGNINNACQGATKSIFGALGVGVRTSVLSVTGRGCLDYLALAKSAGGTMRIEVIVDGRTVLDRTDTHSTSLWLRVLGMASGNGATTNWFIEARYDPAGVQIRRSLQIYVTAVATDSAASAGIAYHMRSVA